jgi:hypothetical protein
MSNRIKIMKKVLFGFLTVSVVSFLVYSCTKETTKQQIEASNLKSTFVDPNIGMNLSFHPTENDIPEPINVEVGVKLTLWEYGKPHRRNYIEGKCNCFGICPLIAPPHGGKGQFPQEYIGRDELLLHITKEDIKNGYVKLYQMQDVSSLPEEHKSFNINEDILEDNGVLFKAGVYKLDPSLGKYGGYKINFEIK